MVFHAMSHVESYTEKVLKVQRPRLTVTRLDPEYYLGARAYKPSMASRSPSPTESIDAEQNFEENMLKLGATSDNGAPQT